MGSKEATHTTSDDYFDQNTRYLWINYIYFLISTHLEVYDMTYWNLGYAQHKVILAEDNG